MIVTNCFPKIPTRCWRLIIIRQSLGRQLQDKFYEELCLVSEGRFGPQKFFQFFRASGDFAALYSRWIMSQSRCETFPFCNHAVDVVVFVSWWSLFSRSKLSTKLASRTLIMTPSFICCQEFFAWAPRLPRACVCACVHVKGEHRRRSSFLSTMNVLV